MAMGGRNRARRGRCTSPALECCQASSRCAQVASAPFTWTAGRDLALPADELPATFKGRTQLIPDWLILGLQSPGPQPSAAWYTAMMALLRPRLGGGGGGSCDPPAGLEDRFRYRSHGVRAGSARRGAGECSQARRHSAMSDALHQRLPSRRRRGTDCLATKRLETPRTRPSCGAACTRTSFT